MKTNIFAVLSKAIILCVCMLTATVCAETSGDYEYSNNGDGTCTITGYTGPGGDITIPDTLGGLTVTAIGDYVFFGSTGLTNVTIGSSITTIEDTAFAYSPSLINITVTLSNSAYSSLEGVLFDKAQTQLIQYPGGRGGDYIIPDGVTTIRNWGFNSCSGLTGVIIPDSVTIIGYNAFRHCNALSSITIPDTIISIGSSAFLGCTGLIGDLTIPDSVITIEQNTFQNCTGLSNVAIGNGVTTIGSSAFSGCSGLNNVTIPDNVTGIGNLAFNSCSNLTTITIGSGVVSIGDQAFRVCSSLSSITVDADNSAFSSITGVLFNKSQTELLQYPEAKVGDYTIPDSVITIGLWAFKDCSDLTGVIIPNGVTNISSSAFWHCNGLANVAIPDSVNTIGYAAFELCYGLTCVSIGNNVTSIGDAVFRKCYGMTDIYFRGEPPVIGVDVFNAVAATVYYLPTHVASWPTTFGGLPTAEWPLSIADMDTDGDVNFWDFAAFAAAWQAVDGVDVEYDPLCDISDPVDGVIDAADLEAFANEWLITPCP